MNTHSLARQGKIGVDHHVWIPNQAGAQWSSVVVSIGHQRLLFRGGRIEIVIMTHAHSGGANQGGKGGKQLMALLCVPHVPYSGVDGVLDS